MLKISFPCFAIFPCILKDILITLYLILFGSGSDNFRNCPGIHNCDFLYFLDARVGI